MERLANLLHSTYCYEKHCSKVEERETSDECTFIVEKSIEDEWSERTHKEWIKKAELFTTNLGFTKWEDALKYLHDMITATIPIRALVETENERTLRNRIRFVSGLLDANNLTLS